MPQTWLISGSSHSAKRHREDCPQKATVRLTVEAHKQLLTAESTPHTVNRKQAFDAALLELQKLSCHKKFHPAWKPTKQTWDHGFRKAADTQTKLVDLFMRLHRTSTLHDSPTRACQRPGRRFTVRWHDCDRREPIDSQAVFDQRDRHHP